MAVAFVQMGPGALPDPPAGDYTPDRPMQHDTMSAPPVPWTYRGICVHAPWNLRIRGGHHRQRVRRKEPPMPPEPDLVFPPFRLDLAQAQLWRGSEPVPLRPKAFAVLHYLVAHAPQLVTSADLLQALWGEAYVSEGLLRGYIRALRAALRDEAQAPRFIATVARRGWRFLAPVTLVPPPAAPPTPARASAAAREAPGRGGGGSRPPAAVRLPGLLVGREAEMAQLLQSWARAQQGERQVVFVTGEAGIGKTMLVDALVAQVAATTALWLGHGQCIEAYGAGEAYLPVLEA